jgi:hypothetical protein
MENNKNRKNYDSKTLIQENWDYFCGNQFKFWNGPKPPVSHPRYAEIMLRLKEVFHSYNIIAEVAGNYLNALLGKQPNWYLSANSKPLPDNNQAEETLQEWLKFNNQLSISNGYRPLLEAVSQMLICDEGFGQGVGFLRIYTPKRLAQNADPMKRIVFHCPMPGTISLECDDDGFVAKASYSTQNGLEEYELLDSGRTKITDKEGTREIDLDGNLPLLILRGNCLITKSLKETQNSINKTLTLKDQNLEYAGFLERVITNGQLPGNWVKDTSFPEGERFVPDGSAMQFGANSIAWIQGIPIGDPKNPAGYTTPQMQYRDPVSISTFADSFALDRTCAYMEAGLGHLLSAGDGSLAGISRSIIKQDYESRLSNYAQTIQAAYESLLKIAASLINPQWREYTPVVSINLATGDPTPEELNTNIQEYSAGLISRTTAMSRAGIEDPDAEQELILRERETELKGLTSLQPTNSA